MSGNYETELDANSLIISDVVCKRLLSAMQYGIIITHGDGHRWIYSADTDENESLDSALHDIGLPSIRSKCYGSVVDALNRVDGALKVLGRPSLLEAYENQSSYNAWG